MIMLNKLFHLGKYNLIFNKIRIAFLTVLSLVIVGLCHYFYTNETEMGEGMMQYSFYVMFMIFTGKINAKNSTMFDIKHLVALPLSKNEIVFLKSFADTVQLLPIACVFLYGFSLAYPKYHMAIISIMMVLVITFSNIIAFNKRIDFSRMQHSKASFKNSFLFLHKYLEMMLQITFAVIGVAIVVSVFGSNILYQEYGFFILICIALVMSGFNTLKMLKDETRSYFMFKRDVVRIGFKLVLVGSPLFIFHSAYKGNENIFEGYLKGSQVNDTIKENIKKIENLTNKEFLLWIVGNEEKKIQAYIKDGKEIPWESEVLGNYPIHLAVRSGNINIVNLLLSKSPEEINRPGKRRKSTPIFTALKTCNLKMAEHLINKKANLNHKNKNGDTPVIIASQRGCLGGVVMLSKYEVDFSHKNNKGKTVFDYIGKKNGIEFLVKSNLDKRVPQLKRLPASKN